MTPRCNCRLYFPHSELPVLETSALGLAVLDSAGNAVRRRQMSLSRLALASSGHLDAGRTLAQMLRENVLDSCFNRQLEPLRRIAFYAGRSRRW